MKAIIVEDELYAREALERLLRDHCPEVNVQAMVSSVQSARDALRANTPDLVFLDVKLCDGIGLEILSDYSAPPFGIVFTSAYQEYALPAIKFQAVDFLLKPISGLELAEAVRRAEERITRERHHPPPAEQPERIALPTATGFVQVRLSEVIRFEALRNYTRVILSDKREYLLSRHIGNVERSLLLPGFMRVHNTHLVNLAHVREYIRGRGGSISMNDGVSVPVSARRRDDFLRRFHRS